MTKQEYMEMLGNALSEFGDDVKSEIIEDYEQHFTDGYSKGKTDDRIIEELGSVEDLVDELKELRGDNETPNDKQDFEKKTKSFEDYTKSFASGIGSIAATIANEAEKLFNGSSEGASNLGKNIVAGFSEVGDVIVEKSTKFANEVKSGYNQSRDKKESSTEEASSEAPAEDASITEPDETSPSCDISGASSVRNVIAELHVGEVNVFKSEDGEFHAEYINEGSANQQLAYKYEFIRQGDTAYVSVKKQPGISNFFQRIIAPPISVTIMVPESFGDIKIHTNAGNTNFTNINAHDIKTTTLAGNVNFTTCSLNSIDANTMAGNVYFNEETADTITCKSNAGNVTIEGSIRNITTTCTAGNAKISTRNTESVTADNTAGNINVSLTEINGIESDIGTTAGNATICFDGNKVKGNKFVKLTFGDGSVKVNCHTTAGNVSVTGKC